MQCLHDLYSFKSTTVQIYVSVFLFLHETVLYKVLLKDTHKLFCGEIRKHLNHVEWKGILYTDVAQRYTHWPQWKIKYLRICAPSENSDQPAYSHILIRISTGSILNSIVSSCGQWILSCLYRRVGWLESSLGADVKRRVFLCCDLLYEDALTFVATDTCSYKKSFFLEKTKEVNLNKTNIKII